MLKQGDEMCQTIMSGVEILMTASMGDDGFQHLKSRVFRYILNLLQAEVRSLRLEHGQHKTAALGSIDTSHSGLNSLLSRLCDLVLQVRTSPSVFFASRQLTPY